MNHADPILPGGPRRPAARAGQARLGQVPAVGLAAALGLAGLLPARAQSAAAAPATPSSTNALASGNAQPAGASAPAAPSRTNMAKGPQPESILFGLFHRQPKAVKPPPPLVLNPPARRISDASLANDLRYFGSLESRLDTLARRAGQTNPFALTQARSWLTVARREYDAGDQSGIIESAVAQTTNLLVQLDAGTAIPLTTPLPAMADKVRPDLWQLADSLKQQANFDRGAALVAQLEVQLAWAGHVTRQQGWRTAKAHLESAEDLARRACAEMNHIPPEAAPPATPATRPPDRAVRPTAEGLSALQTRIAALNRRGLPLTNYFLAKAQHWLDFATSAWQARDRSGVVREAAAQAEHLVSRLEAGARDIASDTPPFAGSTRLREDLWRQAAALKQQTNFVRCADVVARLEVQLVWAGHEYRDLGWRSARPFIQAAERLAREAQARLEGTAPPPDDLAAAETPARATVPGTRGTASLGLPGTPAADNPSASLPDPAAGLLRSSRPE